MHIDIRINPNRENAKKWGEYNFAILLAKALANKGVSSDLMYRNDPMPKAQSDAVTLHITGPYVPDPFDHPSQLLWMISVPNVVTFTRLAHFDHTFVASEFLTGMLKDARIPASYLPQATDTYRFAPSRCTVGDPDIPLCFVGNAAHQRQSRDLVLEVFAAGFEVQVWGAGWQELIPDHCWKGKYLEHDEVAEVYARSRVVLNSVITKMPQFGFMSNRSFDALASGACVFSDAVRGFRDRVGGDLVQRNHGQPLSAQLLPLLALERHSPEQRQRRHSCIRAKYNFNLVADHVIAQAIKALKKPRVKSIPSAWLGPPKPTGNKAVDIMSAAASEILQRLSHNATSDHDFKQPECPIIHGLSRDLARLKRGEITKRSDQANLARRARRALELVHDRRGPFALDRCPPGIMDNVLIRYIEDVPQFVGGPTDFDRDRLKEHVALWPRAKSVALPKPLGIFIHLYYDELASMFAEKMQAIEHQHRVYISTDTDQKAGRLLAIFPEAEIRVIENRGRDIFPKLYGFGDVYDRHDVVLHLHGKRSIHSEKLDSWLAHNLSCLVPDREQVNRIISFFKDAPNLGIIAPAPFAKILPALHWAFNSGIAAELGDRMGISELPDDNVLEFPAGSMFWARVDALRPLLDLNLRANNFPPECGQVDGTVAHAIERLVGVVCQAEGWGILNVVEKGSSVFRRYRVPCKNNGQLRAYVEKRLGVPSRMITQGNRVWT